MKNLQSIRCLIVVGAALAWLTGALVWAADDFTLETARSAAARGDAPAQFYLGRLYAHGKGVPRDDAKAVEYFRASAAQGFARAENNLGAYYASGLGGLPQDDAQAVNWFRKAAEQGDPLAQFSLGQAYEWGRGTATNLTEAAAWYQRAAEQNQTNAIAALGDLYLAGPGGAANYQKARLWLEKAAAQGSLDALNSLGYIQEKGGHGLSINQALAADYYRQAAEKGFAKAQMNLGRMYMMGIGVSRDYIEAFKWFCLALHNGENIARHYLEELQGAPYGDIPVKPMTSAQIQEAVERAEAFEKYQGKNPGQLKPQMFYPTIVPAVPTNAVP